MSKKAVVLLSGGLDSTTVLAIAKSQGFDAIALSFDYGQRHKHELVAARRVAKALGAIEHVVITMDFRAIGGSALTADIDVPKDRPVEDMRDIPVTYVPARNSVFLSVAAGLAEARGASEIFIGVNALDYSGYPDCRPEFIVAMQAALRLGTKISVSGKPLSLCAPLVAMSKSDIIKAGAELGVDFGLTHSCYDPAPDGRACGRCDSCALRRRGFSVAGHPDPTQYTN